jgi:type I restriction-modification system DNA methylase subunit
LPGLEDLKRELPEYLAEMRRRKSQPGKEIIFTRFAERVFGVKPETIEMEVPIESKLLLVRGRIDAVFGNIIMEFKVDLKRELDDAREELAKYFQSFAERYPGRSYIGIAHDGLEFRVFQPVYQVQFDSGKTVIVSVREIDRLNLESEQNPERIYLWFDAYLFMSDRVYPSSEDIKKRLGTESPTFHGIESKFDVYYDIAMRLKRNRLKYENWAKALEVVYGERVEGRSLFIKHTYLATLAKLLVHLIITKAKSVSKTEIRGIVYGDFYSQYGITNYIEEDFYTWILDKQVRQESLEVIYSLMRELLIYNLDEVNEDFLKSLYEELVDPEVRHDLGEYYTPDWLAEKAVDSLLKEKPDGSVLDPACGSGTFLFAAIRWKLSEMTRRKVPPLQILNHIVSRVQGADIHPLAVVVAKTNYLLALRSLLGVSGRGPIRIPIYLCDTLIMPSAQWEYEFNAPVYHIPATKKTSFSLPEINPKHPEVLDLLIEQMGKFAKEYEKRIELSSLAQAKRERPTLEKAFLDQVEQFFVFKDKSLPLRNFRTLLDLIEGDENSIWVFILKNTYKPVTLATEKFDFVVGNPPWIVFRSTDSAYQEFLKPQITKDYKLLVGRGELITHMEVGTYFLLRAADLYLRQGGRIGFVLPRSVFSADQHDGLRRGTYQLPQSKGATLLLTSVWDCERVEPLFNIASCVVFGEKTSAAAANYPLECEVISGKLPTKNMPLSSAAKSLASKDVNLFLESHGKRSAWTTEEGRGGESVSPYRPKFAQGATIVPRAFWFVKLKPSELGFDAELPPITSSESSKSSTVKVYENVKLEGNMEVQFLFCSVLGDDVVPFGFRNSRMLVLPAETAERGMRILNAANARKNGYPNLAMWLEKAEVVWKEKRGAKAERMTIYERLDRMRGLTAQNPRARYRVVYPDVQRVSIAARLDTQEVIKRLRDETGLRIENFVVDTVFYRYETNNEHEADYLAAILNSPEIDRRLGELRRRSQRMQPHVHKKIFDVAPIPAFEASEPIHDKLSGLGEECRLEVARYLQQHESSSTDSIAKVRSQIREILKPKLEEIDRLTVGLLR